MWRIVFSLEQEVLCAVAGGSERRMYYIQEHASGWFVLCVGATWWELGPYTLEEAKERCDRINKRAT